MAAPVRTDEFGVTSGSARKAPSASSFKVSRVEIERANNDGYTVTTYYRSKNDGGGYREPTRDVFTDEDKAVQHVFRKLKA